MSKTNIVRVKQDVRSYYPDVYEYCKNKYWYIVPNQNSGNTLGSGSTRLEAWIDAYASIVSYRRNRVNEKEKVNE